MSVCTDQQTFNTAFSAAMKNYINQQENKKLTTGATIFCVIYIIFLVWAIMLALSIKTTDQTERILNIILACIAPPLYIVGFYVTK
jgi:hypothetical protein